jgi:ABC-type Na+ efflux pump permease subunit
MTQKFVFGLWLILTALSALFVLFRRFSHTSKWKLSLYEVLDLALAVLGGISGVYLIFQAWSLYEKLQKLVGTEGPVAMTLGGFASIWFGFGKIHELASKR